MILKLQDGGESVAVLVQHIYDDVSRKPGKAAQYQFSGLTSSGSEATLWIAVDSAERQFARIGVDRSSIVGQWVEFAKTQQGYIDIRRPAWGAAPAAPRATASLAVAPVVDGAPDPARVKAAKRWRRAVVIYGRCVDEALKSHAAKLAPLNIPATHTGIAATAGALFTHYMNQEIL